MEKLHKVGQITKTLLVSVLLMVIPFISSSMRTSYLYFLLNILILVLACESGILQVGALPDPNSTDHEKKRVAAPISTPYHWSSSQAHGQINSTTSATNNSSCVGVGSFLLNKQPILVPAENPTAVLIEKAVVVAETKNKSVSSVQKKQRQQVMKRCPSVPSLFFIGTYDDNNEDITEEYYYDPQEEHPVEEEIATSVTMMDEDDMLTKQELFSRAEMFIGNFYKQLKMQREESWKKLHGLYQRP